MFFKGRLRKCIIETVTVTELLVSGGVEVYDETGVERHPKIIGRTEQRDVLFATTAIFLPILKISLILLGFTFYGRVRLTFPSDDKINQDADPLPKVHNPSLNNYFSDINSPRYVLVGSWASNITLELFALFMLLFSFLVAWAATTEADAELSHIMYSLLNGSQGDRFWRWLKHVFVNAFCCGRTRKTDSRSRSTGGIGNNL